MKRILNIFVVISAALSVFSCTKARSAESADFNADFEPDKLTDEVTVVATTASDLSGIDADIILNLDEDKGCVISSLTAEGYLEINLSAATVTAVKHKGIFYLAARLDEDDDQRLSSAIALNGGMWVLYVDGEVDVPGLIDCVEGFMGQNSTYSGPGLHMHTDLYSLIGSFSKDETSCITFTIKGETND